MSQKHIKNTKKHLKRNLLLISSISVIIGLIFTIHLLFQGIANSYTELASNSTNGKTIIVATNSTESIVANTPLSVANRADIIHDIEIHGGEILGNTKYFGVFNAVVLPNSILENRTEVDVNNSPDDAAPTLVSTFLGSQLLHTSQAQQVQNKVSSFETFKKKLIGKTFTDNYGAKYYIVGISPGSYYINNLSFKQVQADNDSPINPLLEFFTISPNTPIIIDNGKSNLWQRGENIMADTLASSDSVVAIFEDKTSLYDYYINGNGIFPNTSSDGNYFVSVLAGLSPETLYIFENFKSIINITTIILMIILGVIIIFTSIRLIQQDYHITNLYYNLDATTKQINLIYLCYFLETLASALLFAFITSSILLLIFNISHHELISEQAMLSFSLQKAPDVFWYGLDIEIFLVALATLGLAPLCTIINSKSIKKAHSAL